MVYVTTIMMIGFYPEIPYKKLMKKVIRSNSQPCSFAFHCSDH